VGKGHPIKYNQPMPFSNGIMLETTIIHGACGA
jgi:hypothetical protein